MATARVEIWALFALGLITRSGVVIRTDHKVVLAVLKRRCDVKCEGCTPTVVLTNGLTVDPGFAMIIDGTEVKQNAFAFPIVGDVEYAMIPDGRYEIGVLDAGQFRFGTEGHSDRFVKIGRIGRPTFLFA